MLLVATATQWLGAARMPRVLARAGFDVSVLIPKGSLAEKSRFVSRIGFLPDNATSREWVYAFAATVKATAPRIVLPCDDTALRLMMLLATAAPPDLQPELKVQLQVLINPVILESRGQIVCEEGCLSVPGVFDTVERAEWIRVQALDADGRLFEREADGLLAICIQHEMDHLLGKVFVEYLSRLKQERIVKKLKKMERVAL